MKEAVIDDVVSECLVEWTDIRHEGGSQQDISNDDLEQLSEVDD